MLSLLSDPRLPLALAALVALMRAIYAIVSRLAQPYPRARAAVEALAALAPDVLRAALQFAAAVTGRPALRLDAVPSGDDPAALRRELDAALTRARAAEESLSRLEAARVVTRPMRPALASDGQAGRASVGALLLVLLVAVGCASAPAGPAATIGKVRAWWQEICGLGDSTLAVAQHATEVATADAGVNETGVSVNNAPSGVNSSGGEAPPSPSAASAADASTAGGIE